MEPRHYAVDKAAPNSMLRAYTPGLQWSHGITPWISGYVASLGDPARLRLQWSHGITPWIREFLSQLRFVTEQLQWSHGITPWISRRAPRPLLAQAAASMEPRHYAVDKTPPPLALPRRVQRFNGATALRRG